MKRFAAISVPGGSVGFVAHAGRLSHVFMTGRSPVALLRQMARTFPDAEHQQNLLPEFQEQLRDYFAGREVCFKVSPDLSSLSPFQQRVLRECARIGYGQTMTYGQLARKVGKPRAARAVGGALARNAVPLVIPCHRVVAGDGSLGGFSAEQGVKLKRRLIELESGRTASGPGSK